MERSLVGNYEYLLANFLKVLGIEIGTLNKRQGDLLREGKNIKQETENDIEN